MWRHLPITERSRGGGEERCAARLVAHVPASPPPSPPTAVCFTIHPPHRRRALNVPRFIEHAKTRKGASYCSPLSKGL